jgi:hypothetical protein
MKNSSNRILKGVLSITYISPNRQQSSAWLITGLPGECNLSKVSDKSALHISAVFADIGYRANEAVEYQIFKATVGLRQDPRALKIVTVFPEI